MEIGAFGAVDCDEGGRKSGEAAEGDEGWKETLKRHGGGASPKGVGAGGAGRKRRDSPLFKPLNYTGMSNRRCGN
jgi:hypothetical protein